MCKAFNNILTYSSIFATLLSSSGFATVVVPKLSDTPIIHTQNGTISGISLNQFSQDVFLGIPFAEPPTGERRFKRPEPYNRHYGHLDATLQPPTCIGYGPFTWRINGLHSEDCLYLNVVRPQTPKTDLPVLFFIYAGGFFEGGIADPRSK